MSLISTTKGMIHESVLERAEGTDADGTAWVEYRLNDELVRRDVQVKIKGVESVSAVEGFK